MGFCDLSTLALCVFCSKVRRCVDFGTFACSTYIKFGGASTSAICVLCVSDRRSVDFGCVRVLTELGLWKKNQDSSGCCGCDACMCGGEKSWHRCAKLLYR